VCFFAFVSFVFDADLHVCCCGSRRVVAMKDGAVRGSGLS
jgi:hypothetical protein